MTADVHTLLLVVTVTSVAMAGALLLLGGGRRQGGLLYWAMGLLLGGAGYALYLLRGSIPDVLSGVLGNALLSAMFCSLIAAVQCFQGRTPRWLGLLPAPVLMAALMAGLPPDLPLRVTLSNALLAAQALWLLWILRAPGAATHGRGACLLMAGVGLQAALLLARSAASAALGQQGVTTMLGGTVQTLTFMVMFNALLVASMGFVFMGKEHADERNRRLAAQDELTGVANRRSIIAALDRDVARSQRTREPLALMMIDVDHFKQVNDRFGHLAGDAVLRNVASVLRQRVRAQDIVGRYGGEEFLVVLPDTTREGAYQLALQLCAAVQNTPCLRGGESIAVTVSIGVFGGRLEPEDHWDLLLHAADSALYRAKQAGRNRAELAQGVQPVHRDAADTGDHTTFFPSV